ncbi:HDOD domain-containing protein [Ruficoccus amylovorans]|uniref:HDOD domain-containing protein n=1 Tax=Ruficoccus amylovorans TaxID=1804625 RepID=A0A842HHG3_9BACT|nr:HDOD domain-containing protein [Ruficoccus amylovorans]MBC2594987.1 HDOD domain-containing protein [Ruficoccus amylovorans]
MPDAFTVGNYCQARIASYPEIERRLRECPTIASFQGIRSSLLALSADTNVPVQEIAHLLGKDQALTARLLRMVNSVFGGLTVKVSNIEEAIFFLGLRQVHDLILSAQVFEQMRKPVGNTAYLNWEDIIRHSVASAILCREVLSISTGLREDDTYYLIGLLHNIGKLVMLHVFPEELEVSMGFCESDPSHFEQHERSAFGWSHADLGSLYLAHNGLPNDIVEAVCFHHAPDQAPANSKLAAGAQLADIIARQAGFCCGFEPPPTQPCCQWEEEPAWTLLFGNDPADWKRPHSAVTECLKRLPALTHGLT